MEVACGEHGDWVNKLVVAVNNGKCNNWARGPQIVTNNHSQALVLAINSNNQTNGSNCIANNIAKENINRHSSSSESSVPGNNFQI